MALTIHDPSRIGLRRAIRAAIALPIALGVTLYLVDDKVGGVYAALGTAALLITADFAGTWQHRLRAYVLTGIIGTPVIVIGWAASLALVPAVLTTLVVGFVIAFVSLLRGTLAVGAPAVMLTFVVSVTIGGEREAVPDYLGAWWIAVTICTIVALTIVPRDVRAQIRTAISQALAAGATTVRAVWVDEPSIERIAASLPVLAQSVCHLNSVYDGNPFRPSGATARDRSLTLLVNHVNGAALLLRGAVDSESSNGDIPTIDGRRAVAMNLAASLDAVSRAATDRTFAASAADLDAARNLHRTSMEAWVLTSAQAGVAGSTIAEVVRADHLLRMAALMGEQILELGRQLNGFPTEQLDHEPPIPARPWSTLAVANLSLNSPWLRTALRTGIGLAIAVLVVQLAGLEHGLWVMLGVISVLRYDGAGTRHLAIPAIVGTVVGVVVATVVLFAVGSDIGVLWVLLPMAVFLAAWAPVAVSFPVGQAAFSGFILIALGIIEWPPNLTTGLIRIQDILIGIAVALVVGLLMWPRGALGALHGEIADGLRASSSYLSLVVSGLSEAVTPADLARARLEARYASERASDTYDMSIMQRGSGASEALRWASMATSTHLLLAVSRILGVFASDPPILASAPSTIFAVQATSAASHEHWSAVIDRMAGDETYAPAPRRPPTGTASADLPDPVDVHDALSAHAYVAAVWTIDWLQHLDSLAANESAEMDASTHA